MLPSSSVDHVLGYRLGTTAKLITLGLLESSHPPATVDHHPARRRTIVRHSHIMIVAEIEETILRLD